MKRPSSRVAKTAASAPVACSSFRVIARRALAWSPVQLRPWSPPRTELRILAPERSGSLPHGPAGESAQTGAVAGAAARAAAVQKDGTGPGGRELAKLGRNLLGIAVKGAGLVEDPRIAGDAVGDQENAGDPDPQRIERPPERLGPGQRHDNRAKAQPACPGARPSQRVQRRRDLAVPGKMVPGDKAAVEADILGLDVGVDETTKAFAAVGIGAAAPRPGAAKKTKTPDPYLHSRPGYAGAARFPISPLAIPALAARHEALAVRGGGFVAIGVEALGDAPLSFLRDPDRSDRGPLRGGAAPGTCGILLALRAAGAASCRRAVRCRLAGGVARHDDPGVYRAGRDDGVATGAGRAGARQLAPASRHGGGIADCQAGGAVPAGPRHQPGDRARLLQSRPLAEPLACGAAELDLFPERLCRPHRAAGHADRPGAARERRLRHQRGVVHPRLWQRRDRPVGPERPAPDHADPV